MEPGLALTAATNFSYEALALLVNRAYADYFLPIWLDAERFAQMCQEEDVALAHSVVAMVEGDVVGTALLSRREDCGWLSGVGVLPLWRRKGIARQMVRYLQRRAGEIGLTHLLLEVLEQNDAAFALYERLGFHWRRDFLVLTSEAGYFTPAPLPAEVQPAPPATLLADYVRLHEVEASWQRALPTLWHRLGSLQGLGYHEAGELVGYVLYDPQRHHQAVHDLAVRPTHPRRLEIAQTLLEAMHASRPHVGGYVVNLPADDPLLAAFARLHYRIWHRQCELIWNVPRSAGV